MKHIDEEYIRIFAGILMLVIIFFVFIFNKEIETVNYVIIGLSSFLIGGAILNYKNKDPID